jgi:dihydropyrimidinase
MSLLIKNGEIVTATERYKADIYCENETITRIGPNLEAPPDADVIDAAGKYVFPGFIDPHVHIYLPFMGTFAKDTYETGSKAALMGGTTSLIEMLCPSKDDDLIEAFELWQSKAAGQSACDYTFHMGVPRYDEKAEAQLREIVAAGIASFKIFLAYKGVFNLSDDELYAVMKLAKSLGVITTAHCENADLVLLLQQKLIAEGKTGPEWHYHSRPPFVEASGTARFMSFARATDAAAYVVHLSCNESLHEVMRARYAGVRAFVEIVAPYLTLDMTYAEKPDFEGAKYVMSPPLREKRNQDIFWNALRQGFVNTVATDHAPFDFVGQKDMGRDDFTKIPNGIPSIEERVKLLYSYGVAEGRIDLHTFVSCASTQAAKIFGLYPRKGSISVGADADLVVYDPEYEGVISQKTHSMNIDYSAFEGWPIKGRPETVTVRGEVAVREGTFTGTHGRGQLLRREPTHF